MIGASCLDDHTAFEMETRGFVSGDPSKKKELAVTPNEKLRPARWDLKHFSLSMHGMPAWGILRRRKHLAETIYN